MLNMRQLLGVSDVQWPFQLKTGIPLTSARRNIFEFDFSTFFFVFELRAHMGQTDRQREIDGEAR